MLKHIISFVAALCILIVGNTVSFSASDDILSMSFSADQVKTSESISVEVAAGTDEVVRGIQFSLTYDIGKMSVENIINGELMQEAMVSKAETGPPGKITVVLAFDQNTVLNGVIFRVDFRIRDKTGLGDTKITIKDIELAEENNQTITADNVSKSFIVYSDEMLATASPEPAPAGAETETSEPSPTDRITFSNMSGGSVRAGASVAATAAPVTTTAPKAAHTERPADKAAECSFRDIEGHWAAEDIIYLYNAGIVDGFTDTEFAPEQKVTRAEFVKMISAISELEAIQENPFEDIQLGDWYYESVLRGYSSGIINGYGSIFAPDKNITREEMAVIADRCMTYMGVSVTETDMSQQSFSDEAMLADWSIKSIKKMAQAGIINGIDGAFVPAADTTRAQAAVVIKRIYTAVN